MWVTHSSPLLITERVAGSSAFPVLGLPWKVRKIGESLPTKNREESHERPPLKTLAKEHFERKAKFKQKRNHGSWLLRVSERVWKWLRRVKETEFPSYAIGFTQRSCPTNDIGCQCFLNYKKSESSLSQSGMVCPAPPWNSRVQKFLALSVSHSFCLSEEKTLGERSYHSCEGKQKLAEVKYSRKLAKSHANPILKACHCYVTPVSFRRWLVPHLSFPQLGALLLMALIPSKFYPFFKYQF